MEEVSERSRFQNFEFLKIDVNKSIMSNFLIIQENFKRMLSGFRFFEKTMNKFTENLNTDKLSAEIRKDIIEKKLKISVNIGLGVNDSTTFQSVGGEFNFVITRDSTQSFSVKQADLDKNKLDLTNFIVQCRQHISEIVLYPIIQCYENKITITFSEVVNQGFTILLF